MSVSYTHLDVYKRQVRVIFLNLCEYITVSSDAIRLIYCTIYLAEKYVFCWDAEIYLLGRFPT